MKFSLKKLQSHIKEPLPDVDTLREKIIFHAFEVESLVDDEIDIKVLPDRAFDAKEDHGMAREIAGLFHLNLAEPDHYEKTDVGTIVFSLEKVSTLLGRTITADDVRTVFDAYHYVYEINDDTVTLSIPPWRNDLIHVYDICDELGRYLGYDTVPATLPSLPKVTDHIAEFEAIAAKKYEMIAQGYHEVMTYSLTKKGDFQVAKGPKGKDFLRTNLLDGLKVAYALNKQNEELLPNQSAKIFEIGKVFPKSGEELHVAWIDEKGNGFEEILSTEISPSYQEGARGGLENKNVTKFIPWSEYPFITRDVSFWVPEETDRSSVTKMIQQSVGTLLIKPPRIFDMFTKNGRTSLAIRLVFQSFERTLTNEEVDAVMVNVYQQIQGAGYEIR